MRSAETALSPPCSVLAPDAPEWLDFIQSMPGANLFHHPSWIDLMQSHYHFKSFILVVKNSQDQIAAGVPLMEVPGFRQLKLISLPFTDHCSPLYSQESHLISLVKGIDALYQQNDYHQVELRCEYPAGLTPEAHSAYVLSTVSLDADPAKVSARIKPKHFRRVKVSQERGVTAKLGIELTQLKDFYQLHWQNRRKHGLPVQPWKYFLTLYEHVLLPGYGFIITAYHLPSASHQPACIGAGLFLVWNRTLIEKYSAVNQDGRSFYAMDRILWDAVCWGCEHGVDILDMGRTDLADEGLRTFKLRWGAQETALSYSYLPQNHDRPQQNQWIPLFQNAIRRSPPWVCRLTGELFYQYFA